MVNSIIQSLIKNKTLSIPYANIFFLEGNAENFETLISNLELYFDVDVKV